MKLELAVDGDRTPWQPDAEAENRLHRILAGLGPADGILEVVLTDDQSIRRLNRDYRQKDQSTDVLSFSYLEGHEAHRAELLRCNREAREFGSDPQEGELLVGQVLISVETMIGRDIRLDHSDREEFLFLVIHGLLHTLGYDHQNEEDAREMEEAQEEILEAGLQSKSEFSEGGTST